MSTGGHSSTAHSAPVILFIVAVLCALLVTTAVRPDAAAVAADGPDDGMPVLRRAATAESEVAYSAVRQMTGPGGRTFRVRVVNSPGDGISLSPVGAGESTLMVRSSPALESLDDRLLRMLQDTYAVGEAGTAELAGRETHVVEAARADGTVAGRFWVDTDTGLLLGRAVYEAAGEPAFSVRLTGLLLGEASWPADEEGDAPWGDDLDGAERARLREEGWPLQEHLAWNLRLVDARSTEHAGHRVVHAIYSDGLSQVSVFTQRGKLDTEHSPVSGNGYVGTGTGGNSVTTQHDTIFGGDTGQYQSMWQADGFVFTVLADAPAGLASTAVTALPEPGGAGFWTRVQRGLARLGIL